MGSSSTPPPPQSNPGRDLTKYVQGLQTAMPTLLGVEAQSRPQFGQLNLADISQFLQGSNGQAGVIGLGGQAGQQSQAQIEAARTQEYKNMLANTGTVRSILGGVSPGSEALNKAQTDMALGRYQSAQGLNFQEGRMADQTAREAFAQRGRLNDTSSVAAEILGREEVLQNKRAEAAAMGQQAFGQEQQFASPAMGILGGSPASVLLGQDYLNRGQQALGSATPQLIDTGAGISLGQQQASNLANWQQNQASAQNAQNAQYAQMASTAIMAIASAYSDKRVKENIKKVGKTDDGLPIYTYNLLGNPKTEMGVMAQEVKKKKPKALGPKVGGIMTVDYSKL